MGPPQAGLGPDCCFLLLGCFDDTLPWRVMLLRLIVDGSEGIKLRTGSVGKKSEVADADKAARQNVDQESAQELIGGDRHHPLLVAVRIVFPAKRDSDSSNATSRWLEMATRCV